MKKQIAAFLLSLALLPCAIAENAIERQFQNNAFDGARYEIIGDLEQPTREFTALLSLEAAIVKDGTYMWACRQENAKGELKWAFYRAGWNNNFGFYITTKPKPIFLHIPSGSVAKGMHSLAAVVTKTEIRLYCDDKLQRTTSLEGYTYEPEKGKIAVGALDAKKTSAFFGKIGMVKVVDFAMNPKQVEYAFGTPRRPKPRVFSLPIAKVPEKTRRFKPELERDKWTDLQVVDWRIAPESSQEELRQIAEMVKRHGFDALFVSGSFRYLFAERYGDRNWWATIPWTVYRQTLSNLNRACKEADLDFVMHLTAWLGLYPDLEREFHGMVARELDDPDKEIDWPNYYGRKICPNNAEFREKYLARLRELFQIAPHLGGLMVDETSYGNAYTGCGCLTCRSLFKKRFGKEPPSPQDNGIWGNYSSELWRQWLVFRCETIRNNTKAMADAVQEAKPNALFTGCNCNPTHAHIPRLHGYNPLQNAGANLLFYENEPCNPWSWRYGIAEGKYFQSDGRPILMQGYAASLSQAYFQLLLSAVMNWGNSQWSEFNQYRLLPVNWFSFYRPLSYGLSSPARIALVVSPEDNVVSDYNSKHGNAPMDYIGWAQVLTERHIPFDVIHSENIGECSWKYTTIIVPHTMCWSDNGLDALQAFLNRGGRVLASPGSFSFTLDGATRLQRKWRGNLTMLSECHGERCVMPKIGVGWYGNGGAWLDDRDNDAQQKMLKLLADDEKAAVIGTNLPEGVVVMCDKQQYSGYSGWVVRMLNLTGTIVADGGYAVPMEKEYEFIDYPPLKGDYWIRLQTGEPVLAAYMISPDFSERVRLAFKQDAGIVSVRLPGLARYGVVYLATKGNLIKDIAPEQVELEGAMPATEEFDVRMTSVR